MPLKKAWTLADELEKFRAEMRQGLPMSTEDKRVLTYLVERECCVLNDLQWSLEQAAGYASLRGPEHL